MTDTKPKGSFAKLMSSSTPDEAENEASFQKTRIPENQNSRNTANASIQPPMPEFQKSGFPANQKVFNQKIFKRETYTKATYRLCDEAIDAIEHAKRLLRRQYKIKVNLEEIAEEAILKTYKDLITNKEKSNLVATFSGKPENQKDGIPENNNS